MIDLQYVVLYVSSFVILFHRGRKSGRRKNGKVRGKSKEKHRIKKAEKGGHTRMASPRARKNGRNATKPTREKTVLCRVASELSLVPASLCRSIRQEEDFIWEMC